VPWKSTTKPKSSIRGQVVDFRQREHGQNTVAGYSAAGGDDAVTASGPDSLLPLFLLGRPFLFQSLGRFFFGLLLTVLAFTHGAVSGNGWNWEVKSRKVSAIIVKTTRPARRALDGM
jgi:hypothetical protein